LGAPPPAPEAEVLTETSPSRVEMRPLSVFISERRAERTVETLVEDILLDGSDDREKCADSRPLFAVNFTLKLNNSETLQPVKIQSQSKNERGLEIPLKKEHSISK
jgi:hypothetical protein